MSDDHDSSANNSQVTSGEDPGFFSLLSDKDRAAIWDKLLKRPTRQEAPPAPLTEFERDFQAIVPAKLEGYVRLGAYMIQLGIESFSEAHDRVMRIAHKYGAGHLSDAAWCALDAWIDQQILACVDEPPPEGLVTPAQLERIRREVP